MTVAAGLDLAPVVPVGLLPVVVPVVPVMEPVAVAVSLAVSSVRILSIAATWVPQFELALPGVEVAPGLLPAPAVVDALVVRPSAAICRFSSASWVRARPVTALAGMLSSAAFACRRCSSGEADASLPLCVAAVDDGDAGVGAVVGGCSLGGCIGGGGVRVGGSGRGGSSVGGCSVGG
jgi:hypothetical protein